MSDHLARATRAWDRYAAWMRDATLPFWADTGRSSNGGVVERLTLAGMPERPGFKRVRVHARQAYVFSRAHLIGQPDIEGATRAVLDFLTAHGRNAWGGWVEKMGEGGGVVDDDVDLYDQAFVLLALSWW
jgi:mannose/cellobiose epimerase-like protein (N-acyl-D-glucosamine 2-epimerase family)